MKYVVTGSIGHISKPLAEKLVMAGHDVTIITSDSRKSGAIRALGAKPEVGSVEDVEFLKRTFNGADAVYTMVPPTIAAADWKKHIAQIGQNYAEAIKAAGIKFTVNLSSVGAHLPEGCGPVSGIHFGEKALDAVPGLNILHLRPGFFYYNFFALIGMIRHAGFMGGNYGNSSRLLLVHTDDIADAAAEALLQLNFRGSSYRYITSDERTTDEIATVLGKAIGNPDLKWTDFSDDQNTQGLQQAGLPLEVARNYTEMGAAIRNGTMFEDYRSKNAKPVGKMRLEDFSPEFSQAYNA